MGWFDENHPMGEEALAREEEAMNDFLNMVERRYTDPIPANSTPMKRVERPESEWDETKWAKTRVGASILLAKGKAKDKFLLTDKDLLPLSYTKQANAQGYYVMKMYNKREVERRAWEKYGGPSGLKAALKDRANGVKPSPTKAAPKAKAATKKAKSSTSQKHSAKQAALGSSSSRAWA
ncbi:hypothetical protein D9613_008542 [Agrocybe pediades]|uniref:Uncharacterized protein n=1 Tax=Agrocybe pediades TaxID=84607 RepID=A0A8H4QT53_9AGAR|nr:hypothetical protein D9613_008542 [Agrocybe pediades]KAF9556283.1 hypothetical protein CPC08DRAFT_820558 [Agrocybe pediades]